MSDADTTKCGSLNSTSVSSFGSCSTYQGTYTPYPTGGTYSPPPSGSCLTGSHNMGSYCMSDSDSSKCGAYGSSPSGWGPNSCTAYQGTYSPYPTGATYSPPPGSSCPTGSHNMGSYCMSDSDSTKCGSFGSSSVSSFGSCSSYQTTYTPYPSYTSYPSCPSGQWWDSATNTCKSSTTATYTPPPSCPSGQYWNGTACVTSTATYLPPPTCPSGQYWDGTVCVISATPAPTPVPTQDPAAACASSGGTWNGSSCVFPTPAPSPTSSPPPSSFFQHQMAVHLGAVRSSAIHTFAMANTIMNCADSGYNWNVGASACRPTVKAFFGNIFRAVTRFFK